MAAALENSHHDSRVSIPMPAFGPQKRPLPNLAPLHRDQKSALPRGCRFRDFGEAHRNITGRSISSVQGADGLTGSFFSSTNNTNRDVLSRDITPLSIADVRIGSQEDLIDRIFDRKGTRSCSPALVTTPVLDRRSRPLSSAQTSEKIVSPLSMLDDSPYQNRSSDSHVTMTAASTDTTVGRLYKQYQAHILNPRHASDSSPTTGTSQANYSRDGATNRLGFWHDSQSSPPCSGPVIQLMPTPRAQLSQDEKAEKPGSTPVNSSKHAGIFLTVPTRESLMYPKPLRVQSIRADGKHTSLRSCIAVSATGMTTDSDDDPFRYDKDAYNIFLHPSKERDVSAALNHISGLSSHSRATLYSQEDGLATRKISLRPPPIPKEYIGDDPFFSGPTRARSPTPESADGFYDTSAIHPNWAAERSTYEVKVVLQDVSRNHSINTGRRSRIDNDDTNTSDKPLRSSIISPCQNGGLYRRKDKENMPSSERGDWETVATTAADLGSMRLSLPVGGGMGVIGSRGIKITGSSVADVSDDNSVRDVPFDEYASTDRIVQHPSRHEDSEESLQIRHMSGTKIPVIVPKQRVHRVNGFAQNSSRMFPPSQRSGSEAAAALARKVSSPFRQLSGRRPHQFPPMPLKPLPFKLEKGKNRFEFRHYSQTSDRDPLCAKGVYEFQGLSSDTGNTRSETNNITVSEVLDDGLDGNSPLRDSSSSQSSDGTIHSFPFPLIPLPEAARLQAVERAANTYSMDTDPYWAGGATGKKRLHIPERIRIPERTHHRAPATFFASVFAPSSTQSSYQGNRLEERRTMPKDLTMQSAISSTAPGGTWATVLPFGGSSTRHVGPSRVLKTAATRLHLDDLTRRFRQRKRPSFTAGSSLMSRSNTPRLYPWDYQAHRRQRKRGTDPELRAIALSESEGALRSHMHDLERTGVPLDPEAFVSHEARHRRQTWFYCMLAVSMFPFLSVMVYLGKFDSGLSWYTRGEVDRLNARQRRTVLIVMVLQFVLWPIVLALVIWRTQQLATVN